MQFVFTSPLAGIRVTCARARAVALALARRLGIPSGVGRGIGWFDAHGTRRAFFRTSLGFGLEKVFTAISKYTRRCVTQQRGRGQERTRRTLGHRTSEEDGRVVG